MAGVITELTKIRRKLITELASLVFQDKLIEEIDSIPRKVTEEGLTDYRCCKYKEQAILTERIKLLLGVDPESVDEDKKLSEVVREINDNEIIDDGCPYIKIIEEACDHCSIDKIVVTNACRNCVAHRCVNSCPREAIQIVENRAFIDKKKCVECGLCVDACPYGAIIEVDRPCNRACEVDAIVPGETSTSQINYEDCLECGACITACPFGAISSKSDLYKVLQMLKGEENVSALVAPSFVGQFGPMVNFEKLKTGLKELGFSSIFPVALGADMTIETETQEVKEKLKKQSEEKKHKDHKQETDSKLTFNSCCPSFKSLIKKHYPEFLDNVSSTASPMLMTAELSKSEGEDKCVFIGPCLAKKGEANREGEGLIDAVLSFEELASILVAADVNLADIKDLQNNDRLIPSTAARNFCKNGGVMDSILENIKGEIPGRNLSVESTDGIKECIKLLEKIDKEQTDLDFVEGMACEGGCLGGPGALVNQKVSGRLLSKSNEKGKSS